MARPIRIALIGAGSAHFSMTFVRDLCASPRLGDVTLALMDVNPDRLRAVETLANRYAGETGAPLRVVATTDRAEVLTGAQFVVNTALACNYTKMTEGFDVARRHGFDFPGSYHILYDEAFFVNFYQFRLFEELAVDMERFCPNAWLLQVANPIISGITLLGRRFPRLRAIGICHGYAAFYQIVEKMGFARSDVADFAMSGVNHFLWLQRATVAGQDFLPLLGRWLADHADEVRDDDFIWRVTSAARSDFFFRHGVVPVGDTMHWTGAEWWYRADAAQRERYHEKDPAAGWQYLTDWARGQAEQFEAWAADPHVRITEAFPPKASDELMVPLIESLVLDTPRTFVINVMNRGAFVPGLPEDFQVEAPVRVSGSGLQPQPQPPLPRPILAHILRDRVAPVEMELAAYAEGRRDFLEELILMDKYATSQAQARAFLEDILALPWNDAMAAHYR